MFDKEMSDEYPPLVYCEDLSRNGTLWNSVPIGIGTAVLLSEGDCITIRGVADYTFHAEYQPVKQQLDEGEESDRRLFADRYQITSRKLGAGGNGAVYMAINQLTKRQVACKVLSLPAQDPVVKTKRPNFGARDLTDEDGKENIKGFLREVKILQSLSHPNIMGLEKVFRSERTMYIFQELLTGGDLFSYVEHKGSLSDTEAAVIVRQVLKALEYLHGKNIAHRDLKPDNILITSTRAGSRVVLTDFGCAREIEDNSLKRMTTMVGTTEYIAPEIHTSKKRDASTKGYTKSVDMWALGVVTYVLLTTNSFLNEMDWKGLPHDQRIFKAWNRCISSIEGGDPQWTDVGPRPKDFLKKLLVLDEGQRMTVQDALSHSWFTNKAHKAEFEAVYRRATDGWKPTRGDLSQNAIEVIDCACPPQDQARSLRGVQGGSGTVSSSHFPPKSFAVPKRPGNPYTPPSQLIDSDGSGTTTSGFTAQQKIKPNGTNSGTKKTGTFVVPVAKMYKPVHPAPTSFKGGLKVSFPKYNVRSNGNAAPESSGCNVGAKRTVDEIGKCSIASEPLILTPKKQCLRKDGGDDIEDRNGRH